MNALTKKPTDLQPHENTQQEVPKKQATCKTASLSRVELKTKDNSPLDCRRQGPNHGRRRPWRTPAPAHGSSPESWRLLQMNGAIYATEGHVLSSHTRVGHKRIHGP